MVDEPYVPLDEAMWRVKTMGRFRISKGKPRNPTLPAASEHEKNERRVPLCTLFWTLHLNIFNPLQVCIIGSGLRAHSHSAGGKHSSCHGQHLLVPADHSAQIS